VELGDARRELSQMNEVLDEYTRLFERNLGALRDDAAVHRHGVYRGRVGFVLAAVFAALASALTPQQSAATLAARNDTLSARNDTLNKKYDSVSRLSASARRSHPRSNKTPRCSEKGEPADAIADVRILGRNAYEIRGERLTFRALEARLAPQINRSTALGCRYLVRTIATPGVDSPDHSAAVVKLWARFDVSERQQ
jgi:hypothetical protein